MKRFFPLALLLLTASLCGSCAITTNTYTQGTWGKGSYESLLSEAPSIALLERFSNAEDYSFVRSFFQVVFPRKYERYRIELMALSLKEMTDNISAAYISDIRVVLPSGESIDLLDNDIAIRYYYGNPTRRALGIPSKMVENVQPQYLDGRRVANIGSLAAYGDSFTAYFYADIPSAVDNVRFEYTLTVEWRLRGSNVARITQVYEKKKERFAVFTQ